jgi:biopolymer transport protein ExbD
MKIENTKDAVPQINITPLIDILLVLLIIFMVIPPSNPNVSRRNFQPNPTITQTRIRTV